MCFSISLTKSVFERDPRFHYLLDDYPVDRGYHLFGFNFPQLPILSTGSAQLALPAAWGLIPSWADSPEKARAIRAKTLNARGETLGEKPSFKASWPRKRCLVPVEGFYEPHLSDTGKNPWYITRKDRALFFLGGLFQECPPKLSASTQGPYPQRTFSIITIPAKGLLAEVHNEKLRMPLILSTAREEEWLDSGLSSVDPADPGWFISQKDLEAWPVDSSLFKSHADSASVREKRDIWNQKKLF